MEQNDWQRVKEIFNAALVKPATERDGFLQEACGDDGSIRDEVRSLISSFDDADSFLESPVLEDSTNSSATWQFQFKDGQELDKYTIIRRIGAGGMGEVYLARDTKLKRDVALKLLSSRFIPDKEHLKRFEVEAFAASSLNHPNIITVYDVGDSGGTHFIAEEYVEGRTLDKCCQGDEDPGLLVKLNMAVQIASALAATHEAGIIHRDIKPENIMVRPDGLVKVLDFGIAKLSERDNSGEEETGHQSTGLTSDGMVLGTVSYMSPEQARGVATDARTDIWSLGVVIYEMLTGVRPFEGETPTDKIVAIINEDPAPVSRLAEGIPAKLESIVNKALCKDLPGRYQTARRLQEDLEKIKRKLEFESDLTAAGTARHITADEGEAKTKPWTGATATGSVRSRAAKKAAFALVPLVLIAIATAGYYLSVSDKPPAFTNKDIILLTTFENKTGEEIFDGTLDVGLYHELNQSPYVGVTPPYAVQRTLAQMKRKPDERITRELGREICQRRGIKAMLVGTIAKFDFRYLITLEVDKAETGETIAVTRAEAEGRDKVISALTKAATEMRKKLGESLAQIEKFSKPLEATTKSLEALKDLSLGQELMNKGGFVEAISLFEDAVEKDPDFAMAYLGLGIAYTANQQFDLAEKAVKRAYDLREGVSQNERNLIQDYYYFSRGDFYKSIENLKVGKEMYPQNADFPSALGTVYNQIGQFEKGLSESLEAADLEQNDWSVCYANLVGSNFKLNRFEEAARQAEAAKRHNDTLDDFHFHRYLFMIAFVRSDPKKMQEELDWFKGRPDEYRALDLQAKVAAYKGEWRRARELSNRSLTEFLETGRGDTIDLALEAEMAAELDQCDSANISTNKLLRSFGKNDVEWRTLMVSALALAKCGGLGRASAFADNLKERYPSGTLANGLIIPLIKAEIEMFRGSPKSVIEILKRSESLEPAGEFRPQYLKGIAYLKLNEAERAKVEFQKILDHRGEAALSVLYPLAQLGKARATRNKREYEKFFEMWKDADPDLPILVAAKKEYRALGS